MAVRQLQEMGENLQTIIKRLLANQTLLKLLYYTDKDPLSHDDLTDTQIREEVYEKLVKIVPRLDPVETAKSQISFRVVRGRDNPDNPEFMDMNMAIEVFVPLTQWFIKDVSLRPFLIMSEIIKSLDNKTINGMGKMISGGFDINFISTEMSCYEMIFSIITYD